MSKLIDNEASRKASFGILEALKEAENVEVKKTVMYEGACTGCKSCEEPEGSNDPIPEEKKESLKESEKLKEAKINSNELTKEQLWKLRQEIVLGSLYINDYKNSFGIDPQAVRNFFDSFIEDAQQDDEGNYNNRKTEEFDNAEELYKYYMTCENPFGDLKELGTLREKEIVSDDDTAVVEAEEKIVEGLKVLESANGAFLLKESAGYIVGKNYNEKTGIIEEAECYKTEKVARRVFDKISK